MVKSFSSPELKDFVNIWDSVDSDDWATVSGYTTGSSSVNSGVVTAAATGSGVSIRLRSTLDLKTIGARIINFGYNVMAYAHDNYTSGSQSGAAQIYLTDGANSLQLCAVAASVGYDDDEYSGAAVAGNFTFEIVGDVITIYNGTNGFAAPGVSSGSASQSSVSDGDTQDISTWSACYIELRASNGSRISGWGKSSLFNLTSTKKLIGSKKTRVSPS